MLADRDNVCRRETERRCDGGGHVRAALAAACLVLSIPVPARADGPPDRWSDAAPLIAAIQPSDLEQPIVGLPTVLSPRDADAYRRAFAAAERGDAAATERALAPVQDRGLVGPVLAELHLSPRSKPSFDELQAWLATYADLPDAPAIHALAVKRAPRGQAASLRQPTGEAAAAGRWAATTDDLGPAIHAPMPAGRKLDAAGKRQAEKLKLDLRKQIRAGQLDKAEAALARPDAHRLLADAEIDYLLAQIAAGWFARDEAAHAYALASAAAKRSGAQVGRAHWIAGLAAFSRKRFDDAARHFEALARGPKSRGWDAAAGAFWASRAHLRAGRFDRVNQWLALAAEQPRSFYGLLARRALGLAQPFVWEPPRLMQDDVAALRRSPAGARALMLAQVDQPVRAEAELARVSAHAGPQLQRPLLTIALRAGMPALAMRLARELGEIDGVRYEGAAYPLPPWKPAGGFEVDRALVYAFMRQESNFNPRAVSPAGAKGLMQIMPGTARILNGGAPVAREKLLDPGFNVTLGQRYLARLLESDMVEGDLIRLAAAYNSGPGNVVKWQRRHGDKTDRAVGDALLAIETLPSPETRHFITRILYSYWMYSARLGQETPSLDAVAQGKWPAYVAQDGRSPANPRNAQAPPQTR